MEHRYLYIAGWGKGGSTFTKRCFTCFKDTWVAPGEPNATFIAPTGVTESNIVVKQASGHQKIREWLDRGVKVLYVIRDPRDRIASRWLGGNNQPANMVTLDSGHSVIKHELLQLEFINAFEEFAPLCLVIRYEDLCTRPNELQKTIAEYFDLEIKVPFTEVHTQPWNFTVDHGTTTPLKGTNSRDPLRPPDAEAIGRWKRHACRAYAENFVTIPEVNAFMKKYYLDYL